jgi:HAD superfamily hydrolase (TIGR01484 family)
MFKIVFSDFDGTLTLNERMSPKFFEVLDLVNAQQAELIIVSGRSISWGHFLLTHFPLATAIMEGGGVILSKDPGKDLIHEELMVSRQELDRLELKTKELMASVPGVLMSNDSLGRLTDRAIEYRYMSGEAIEKAKLFFRHHGINFSQSNVHINFWCGEITKYKTTKKLLEDRFSSVREDECVYFGDSLNDQSMFEKLPHTVGVSNIDKYLAEMQHPPSTILKGKENAGPDGILNFLKGHY